MRLLSPNLLHMLRLGTLRDPLAIFADAGAVDAKGRSGGEPLFLPYGLALEEGLNPRSKRHKQAIRKFRIFAQTALDGRAPPP